jgi:hypothetical protein
MPNGLTSIASVFKIWGVQIGSHIKNLRRSLRGQTSDWEVGIEREAVIKVG